MSKKSQEKIVIEAFILNFEKNLKGIAENNSEDDWMRGRASVARGIIHHIIPTLKEFCNTNKKGYYEIRST